MAQIAVLLRQVHKCPRATHRAIAPPGLQTVNVTAILRVGGDPLSSHIAKILSSNPTHSAETLGDLQAREL